MNEYTLEVCVDSVESAVAAYKGGATRLELCQNLVIGGTTPDVELYRMVKEQTNLTIHALIRRVSVIFCIRSGNTT
jgi:copper homeostasis protein